MLLSAGLEAANIFFPDFGGDSEGGGDPPPPDDSDDQPKVGDYYSTGGQGNRKFYYVLQSDGSFKKVGRNKPKTGNQFPKSAFDPVIESIKNNQNNNLGGGTEDNIEGGETIDDNTSASLNFDMEYQNKNKLNKENYITNNSSLDEIVVSIRDLSFSYFNSEEKIFIIKKLSSYVDFMA